MPGFGRGDWQETYQALQQEGEGQDHSLRLMKTPQFSRKEILKGIYSDEDYGAFANGGAPTIPYPIRSSLAQVVTIWRSHISVYISWIRRGSPEQLDEMGIGHLFAKVHQIPYYSPIRQQRDMKSPKPVIRKYGGRGRVAAGGTMGVSPRFDKALRVIDYAYKPPVYGEPG